MFGFLGCRARYIARVEGDDFLCAMVYLTCKFVLQKKK